MTAAVRALLALLVLACGGCTSLSALERDRAAAIAHQARSERVSACDAVAACDRASPLRELGERALAESAPGQPRHYALLLDYGQDALVSRLDLIRGARHSIDLQTYIFDEDDAGHLVLDELMAAVRRGVRRREVFALAPATCARPTIDCDVVATGVVYRSDYAMDRWAFALADRVVFALHLRTRPSGAP